MELHSARTAGGISGKRIRRAWRASKPSVKTISKKRDGTSLCAPGPQHGARHRNISGTRIHGTDKSTSALIVRGRWTMSASNGRYRIQCAPGELCRSFYRLLVWRCMPPTIRTTTPRRGGDRIWGRPIWLIRDEDPSMLPVAKYNNRKKDQVSILKKAGNWSISPTHYCWVCTYHHVMAL